MNKILKVLLLLFLVVYLSALFSTKTESKEINSSNAGVAKIISNDLLNNEDNEIEYTEYEVPDNNGFKSFMLHTSITDKSSKQYDLQNNYAYVRLVYRNCLKDSAELINTMFEIIKCKFGQINYDTEFALMDSFSRSLYISTSVIKDELESYRAHDLHLVVDKIDKYRKDINISITEYSEYNFLTNYNYICNNYSSEFDKVLQKQNIEKKEIANGKEPSDINMNVYKNSRLKCILKILGY